MASRIVRKIKRSKNKECSDNGNTSAAGQTPSIIVTPPDATNSRNDRDNCKNKEFHLARESMKVNFNLREENLNQTQSLDATDGNVLVINIDTDLQDEMKLKSLKGISGDTKGNKKKIEARSSDTTEDNRPDNNLIRIQSERPDENVGIKMDNQDESHRNTYATLQRFDVSQLIAELSQNSKSSSTEIQNIQKKLLQQANDILRENSAANVFQIQGVDHQNMYGGLNSVLGPTSKHQGTLIESQPHSRMLEMKSPSYDSAAFKSNQMNPQDNGAQMIPEKLQKSPKIINVHPRTQLNPNSQAVEASKRAMLLSQLDVGTDGGMLPGTASAAGHMQRVCPPPSASFVFSKPGTGFRGDAAPAQSAAAASARAAPHRAGVTYDGAHGVSVYAPAPPAYRMPPAPAPEAALPGASNTLHTHSNKFPIEREVILSSCDKNSKIPILNELKKRAGRLGVVAPDAPPKTLAWTHTMENQQQPSTSNEPSYRQQYHDQSYYGHNTGGAIQRSPLDNSRQKPPVPSKNTSLYSSRDQKAEMSANNSQTITVTVETGKDNTKDAPKSTKSVTKTYHTLKDMISSRFKGKDSNDSEKNNESEAGLNNVADEHRKSARDSRSLEEAVAVSPREGTNRKIEQNIYGRPMPQSRGEPYQQMMHGSASNLQGYSSPSPHQQMLMQHQLMQQQMLMSQQHALGHGPGASSTPQHKLQQAAMMARSQEVLASAPQHVAGRPSSQMMEGRHSQLVADGLYQQQYGVAGRRSGIYQREVEIANFTSLKQTGPQGQYEHPRTKGDQRSPQQLEREIVRQRALPDNRLTASQPQLDEPRQRPEISTAQIHDRARRSSHGNLLETLEHPRIHSEEMSDDGGFRAHLVAQGRSSFENRIKNGGRPPDSSQRVAQNGGHRPDHEGHRENRNVEKNDENLSQKSVDSVYNSSKVDGSFASPPQPAARLTPSRIEDLKAHGKKGLPGSAASSDYDKNGGQSSNVDSGRGSVAYSSGRRPDASLHDTSADSDALGAVHQPDPGTSKPGPSQGGDPEWVDIVESELRQILEPKMHALRLEGGPARASGSSSASSVTPPLPPLSPAASDSTARRRRKHQSLPLNSRPEYSEDYRKPRGRESPPRAWHHQHKQKHSSKRDQHSVQYKKHLFGLDTTDMTSTTTRSLDLSSMLDGQSDSDVSTQDARAIRRQLQGLESMYCEVLKLLGVRKPAAHGPGKYQPSEPRLSKRRYGSMSSLPSSSVSSRPARDKRRPLADHRKKNDLKSINKRFQRLESHVVTLARSVAHLSSEMRTQHLVMQEMDGVRAEIAALRHMFKSQAQLRGSGLTSSDPQAFSNPERVKRLTKFFGDEPPLMRLFLKRLGYEKYASLLESERVGAAELPYVGEERLRALGVPLGPRMRILKEAGAHREHHARDAHGNTSTTLAIV